MTNLRIVISMLLTIGWCVTTTGIYLGYGLSEAMQIGGMIIVAMAVFVGIIWSEP